MKKAKGVLAVCLVIIMILSLQACKGKTEAPSQEQTEIAATPTQAPAIEAEYIGEVELDGNDAPLLTYEGVSYVIDLADNKAIVMNTMASDDTLTSYRVYPEVEYEGVRYPVREIAEEGFFGYEAMESVILPDSITKLGISAFDTCVKLKSIEIPASVTEIGDEAFSGCSSLTGIVIPDSVKKLGTEVFYDCESMTKCVLPKGLDYIPDGLFTNCTALVDFVIPDSVKTIGLESFWYCEALSELKLPEGLVAISERAFYDCLSIKEMRLPASLTSCASDIFDYCDALTTLYVPNDMVDHYSDQFFGYMLDVIGY